MSKEIKMLISELEANREKWLAEVNKLDLAIRALREQVENRQAQKQSN